MSRKYAHEINSLGLDSIKLVMTGSIQSFSDSLE